MATQLYKARRGLQLNYGQSTNGVLLKRLEQAVTQLTKIRDSRHYDTLSDYVDASPATRGVSTGQSHSKFFRRSHWLIAIKRTEGCGQAWLCRREEIHVRREVKCR
jgi:hypothetical protein